ncbi:hypothetical protein PHYSODRAFT_295550 [Phytophthora sojae]|uniref:RxLR effector protein n=1 Tax=Phytophthora sojae (strain P6497) TaxID=1094619 RepID=G4YRX8_PHYSP|nr:hypothetical protein PHYSODRAFT_295550 [Phytophthora sojae]EGZ22955.1 hypothetical protein PHYSODRAFT_295550 [Phytophthora sojae]|eukprot:XP_009518243.1 hypothetical protein PHYSODRAFT_295550 [Phytophthora sojae]
MVSSSQSSPFSLKHLLVTALVAFAVTSTEAAGAKNATAGADNHATFGKITSGNNKCITGDPTSGVTRKDVDWVWENTMSKHVPDFKNLLPDIQSMPRTEHECHAQNTPI